MLNYITENYVWISTFGGLYLAFFMINFTWAKMLKPKADFNKGMIVNGIESSIFLAAIIYAGAPAWVIWSVVALTAVSIGSMFALKLKYSL